MHVDPYMVNLLFDPDFGKMHTVSFASGKGTNFREAVYASRDDSNFSMEYLIKQ